MRDEMEMFKQILMRMSGATEHDIEKDKMLAKLTPAEEVRFVELFSRADALLKAQKKAEAKTVSDRDRLWCDLMDKYDFHGKNVYHHDGSLYEKSE